MSNYFLLSNRLNVREINNKQWRFINYLCCLYQTVEFLQKQDFEFRFGV